ncbi:MAG: tetratricopeptide repeat protein [Patescibacteria group bacterium]|nr:tetratricopeptide repeat protein [Patescibacteria group bacterium]
MHKKVLLFNKMSYISLVVTLLGSILFFTPFVSVTLAASKGFFLSLGITVSLFFWLVARLLDGKFVFPKERIILFALTIPIIFLISSFFSSSPYISLFGRAFEVGTFGSMLVLFLVLFLSAIHFQTEKKIWYFFLILLGGALILGLFEFIFISLGLLGVGLSNVVPVGNLFGSWNDFALFYGLITILTLFTLEFLNFTKRIKIWLYILLGLSLLFLIIINVPLIWFLIGVFSLIVFVYSISVLHSNKDKEDSKNKISFGSLIVVLISLLFLISGNFLGGVVNRYIGVENENIRPSTQSTLQVASKSIRHNPVLGTGPNTFSLDWAQWKPDQIIQTDYWASNFNSGIGAIPTYLVTTGILGFLVWVFFLVLFILRGIQSTRLAFNKKEGSSYLVMFSFILSLYAWVTLIIYSPNILMFMIAFATTGVFIGVLVSKNSLQLKEISFLNDPRNSFFAILALVILLLAAVSSTYLYTKKYVSVIYFSKSLNPEATSESLVHSERLLNKALNLNQSDSYYRTLSQVYIAQIGIIVNDETLSEDTLKSGVQTLVGRAEQSASLAVSQNSNNHFNWVNLGDVYSAFLPLGVANSYESAMQAYDKALELAPANPSILLSKAQVELNQEENDKARDLINEAIEMKGNYIDAIFMLAQIEASEGNLVGAIEKAEMASVITPSNPAVFFQLGILRYNNKDYSKAVSAFERAVRLNPGYLNARYFLGLSYVETGKKDEAITQFTILNQILPDNTEVKKNLDLLVNDGKTVEVDGVEKIDTTEKNTVTDSETDLPLPEDL